MIIKLLQLLISFGKIGLVSLGGGHSMLKLLEYESVVARQWLSEPSFSAILGSTFLFPGLTAVKLAALIGFQVAGVSGLIVSVFALNAPGLVLSLIGYKILMGFNSPITAKLILIVQYGALALLAAALFSITHSVVKQHASLLMYALTVVFFVLLAFFDVSPFWGLVGFIFCSYALLSFSA